jgi:hypothetical protein
MKVQDSRDEPLATIHGTHLCGIYGSDAGRLDLVVPFLLEGLRKRSVCFLVAPSRAGSGPEGDEAKALFRWIRISRLAASS